MDFKKYDIDGFKNYINGLKLKRSIRRIQLHHTYSPSYKEFKGNNHDALQKGMRDYHVNENEWADIGQHFTIFPDGVIIALKQTLQAYTGQIRGQSASSVLVTSTRAET